VATLLAPPILDALASLIQSLKDSPAGHAARWVPQANIPITLKFLGDVDDDRLDAVHMTVSDAIASHQAFAITIANLGFFGNGGRPQIVWAGVSAGSNRLVELAHKIDTGLGHMGFTREDRPIVPHITLARATRQASHDDLRLLGSAIAEYGPGTIGSMTVESVHIVKSDLRPAGPVYTSLRELSLQHSACP
jgi:RNA 2',3'-cyclic 3'-phosphodiesterase